nr:STAS domain-containing protein [uncultured Actinoplanes sp.]
MADSYQIGQGDRAADGTVALLRLSGELDINAREDVHDAILKNLDAGPTDIVVDLAAVTFIDSEALGALIDGYNACQARDVGFRVTNARGLVDRVLTVSGAMELFGA